MSKHSFVSVYLSTLWVLIIFWCEGVKCSIWYKWEFTIDLMGNGIEHQPWAMTYHSVTYRTTRDCGRKQKLISSWTEKLVPVPCYVLKSVLYSYYIFEFYIYVHVCVCFNVYIFLKRMFLIIVAMFHKNTLKHWPSFHGFKISGKQEIA
jgi:hypothetical protein